MTTFPAINGAGRAAAALSRVRRAAESAETRPVIGRVVGATGTVIRAVMSNVMVGEICRLLDRRTGWALDAEVVALAGNEAVLTPLGELHGLSTRAELLPTGRSREVPVGDALLGRVLDGLGQPLDGRGPLGTRLTRSLRAAPRPRCPAAPSRTRCRLGCAPWMGLLTCAEGQRIGIFGEAGGGKSTLVAQIVKGSAADVAVVALVGERGREVGEFIGHSLGTKGLARSVVVVATSDRPPGERLACADAATSIAEHFRDEGKRVLLFVDNVTRYARALREVGLAAGEPPTRRGFPPSAFAALPRLMERAGLAERGSITAFYAVLVEDDDAGDPVAEETRSILDGHIILSRALAGAGHHPAVDVLRSRSRVMGAVTSAEHRRMAAHLRALLARHAEVEFLIQVGEYKPGADALTDKAVQKADALKAFLCQGTEEHTSFEETLGWMARLAG